VDYLIRRGISLDLAEKFNMMYAENSRINSTLFKDRLCIPIYENGVISSIEGRRLSDDESSPKVLYPKNTAVDFLFDIDNLNRDDTVYACEGLMDLFVLKSSDFFKNSTCIFGANVTKRQLEQIKGFKKFVYIPDNDKAGLLTIQKLKDSGLNNLYVLKLPEIFAGQPIKDIGDLPKVGLDVNSLLNRKWLNYIKPLY
jgi:DNA primase